MGVEVEGQDDAEGRLPAHAQTAHNAHHLQARECVQQSRQFDEHRTQDTGLRMQIIQQNKQKIGLAHHGHTHAFPTVYTLACCC